MNFFLKNIYIAFLTFFFFSCISNSAKKADNFSELSSDILGSYRGIQPSYYLKNVNGEDAVVNGEKILFPSTGFQFFIKADGKVSFQQTNLQDNTKYYYNGTYKMVSNTNDSIELECSLIYEKKLDSTDHNSYYILVLAS